MFGYKLRRWLAERRWSTSDLSMETGISCKTLLGYCRGFAHPSPHSAARLAESMAIEYDEVLQEIEDSREFSAALGNGAATELANQWGEAYYRDSWHRSVKPIQSRMRRNSALLASYEEPLIHLHVGIPLSVARSIFERSEETGVTASMIAGEIIAANFE